MTDHKGPRAIDGNLLLFWETGMGAQAWTLDEHAGSLAGVHPIQKGDILMVFNDAARKDVIFTAVVDYDYNIERKHRPMLGSVQWIDTIGVVDGVQKDTDPQKWADMFVKEKPATLILGPNHK